MMYSKCFIIYTRESLETDLYRLILFEIYI